MKEKICFYVILSKKKSRSPVFLSKNMSLLSRFLRCKKQDHYEEKICYYVILSKKIMFSCHPV